jgi:hypothetical protein
MIPFVQIGLWAFALSTHSAGIVSTLATRDSGSCRFPPFPTWFDTVRIAACYYDYILAFSLSAVALAGTMLEKNNVIEV